MVQVIFISTKTFDRKILLLALGEISLDQKVRKVVTERAFSLVYLVGILSLVGREVGIFIVVLVVVLHDKEENRFKEDKVGTKLHLRPKEPIHLVKNTFILTSAVLKIASAR